MSVLVAAVGRALDESTRAWVRHAIALSRPSAPDGDAVHSERRCEIGHALLRTCAREAAQPATLDGQTWITGEVRLDDRTTLLAALRGRGHDLPGETDDARLLLHAYRIWDVGLLDRIAGDFAFALWDGRIGRLLCARDQLGTIPLHYTDVPGVLLVATSIDALLAHPDVGDELDDSAIADFLISMWPREFTSTAFRQIRRVPPGHMLTWTAAAGLCTRRYWKLPRWESLTRFRDARDYGERFTELLDAAVSDRLTGDRVAAQLSGGMDSSSVVASAVAVLNRRGVPAEAVGAVTAVLGGDSGDREGEFARLVADRLGVTWDVVDGSMLPTLDPDAEPLVRTPEPAPYQRTAMAYQLARLPAAHARVALSGAGGDALAWSSPRYWCEWLAHGRVLRLGRALADHERLFETHPRPGVRSGLKRLPARLRMARMPLPDWLDHDFVARSGAQERRPPVLRAAAALDARSLASGPMWSTMCTWADPTFSRLPVRFRYPLLDLRLVRYVTSLPPQPWLRDKRIMREAAASRLPQAVTGRPKELLVDAPPPGHGPAASAAQRALVLDTPGLEQFVDRAALVAAIDDFDARPRRHLEIQLSLGLGLAHWLRHRVQARPQTRPA